MPVVLGGFLAFIFPWTLYLAFTLPTEHVTPHWSLAWAGFDLLEAAGAAATLAAFLRRSALLPVLAAATGALLVCDAWFDVVTSRPGGELAWSATTAARAELPLAGLCFWLAAGSPRGYRATRRPRRTT